MGGVFWMGVGCGFGLVVSGWVGLVSGCRLVVWWGGYCLLCLMGVCFVGVLGGFILLYFGVGRFWGGGCVLYF